MDKRISIFPEHIEVTLSLPWEVAQAIVDDGPGLITALADALKQQGDKAEANSSIKRFEDANGQTEDERWRQLYRQADRKIRQLRAEEGLNDAQASSRIAKELKVPYSTLRSVLTRYRRERREKLNARRNANVIRMHLLGETNSRIKSRLHVSSQTVAKILQEEDDLIRSLRKYRNIAAYQPTAMAPEQPSDSSGEPSPTSYRKEAIRERLRYHARLGVQFHRQLRRKAPKGAERWWALKEMASPYGLHPDYVGELIFDHKRKVDAYLRRRRTQTIVRLTVEGVSYGEIAGKLKISAATVARYFQAYLKKHRERPDLYPLPTKGSDDR